MGGTFLLLLDGFVDTKEQVERLLLFLLHADDAEFGVAEWLSLAVLCHAEALALVHRVVLAKVQRLRRLDDVANRVLQLCEREVPFAGGVKPAEHFIEVLLR